MPPESSLGALEVGLAFREVPRFQECFLGEGSYAPAGVIRQLIDVGFDGFLLDDHVPHMTGDTAYGHRARAHAIGYMQGLLAAIEGES